MTVRHVIESPIEAVLLGALYRVAGRYTGVSIDTQVEVGTAQGKFRIDIAVWNETHWLGVECDGEEWHSSPEQWRSDALRDQALRDVGWRVVRFAGAEIMQDPERCAREVLDGLAVLSKPASPVVEPARTEPTPPPLKLDLQARLRQLVEKVNGGRS